MKGQNFCRRTEYLSKDRFSYLSNEQIYAVSNGTFMQIGKTTYWYMFKTLRLNEFYNLVKTWGSYNGAFSAEKNTHLTLYLHYILFFALRHGLWVLVGTASMRRF